MVRDGFLAAWKTGAQEWRDSEAKSKAAFYPLQEAWKTYEASAFVGGQSAFSFPSADAQVKAFTEEMGRFIQAEIKARESAIQKDILTSKGKDPRPVNNLGVLYARYEIYDKALDQFTKAASMDYGPAMVNLGNITLLKSDPKKARAWFEKAFAKNPSSVPALAGLARACQASDDGAAAAIYYGKLKDADPKTAERYAYLAPSAGNSSRLRASDASSEALLWNDSN